KWSAAFLVLGVLAVGCIKNEPSPGIEAMRNAKASLLNAQAALTQAKVQVEAANAALIQAQASLLQAEEAVIAATAARIQAEADLIQAEVEWQNALTDFHKEAWAKEIERLEIELEVARAKADKKIAEYELAIAQIQDDLVEAMQEYEEALLAFEQWKLENADAIAQALMDALDDIVEQIKGVLINIANKQIDLNSAMAEYSWYVNVEYPEAVEQMLLHMQRDKMRLECQIEYLTGVAAAYETLYNDFHGEFDALIAEFQETINYYRVALEEMKIEYLVAKEEWLNFYNPYEDEDNNLYLLKGNKVVSIANVFSDGGDDPNIHVVNGNYIVPGPYTWSGGLPWTNTFNPWGTTPTGLNVFDVMKRDMRVIADTRAEFEDQESGIIEANIKAEKDRADKAVADYKANWTKWQTYYDEARITTAHVGSRYVAWQTAWNNWNTEMVAYNAHLDVYCDMYEEAGDLIESFMTYLDGTLIEGTLVVPGATNISEVLGGIEFDAGTLADFIFQGNADEVIDILNYIIGLINAPTEMETIITQLKAIMDGTHPEGWPAFWDHATAWTYKPTPVPYGDIMRDVYANSNKDITEVTKEEWYVWLFLYWLFEDKQVVLGLEEPNGGPVITINAANYTEAETQVLEDFFGELNCDEYDDYMVGPSNKAILDAIKAYYDAVEGLGNMENAMFRPYDREWFAYAKHKDIGGGATFVMTRAMARDTYWSWKPFLVEIAPTPGTYTPRTYEDDLHLGENQPDPVDVNNFFFVLEAYQGETGPIPSLDFDITYLDPVCDLYVSYAALLAAGDDCIWQSSSWVGDMRLWKWEDKAEYGSGHFFGAIWMTRNYQAYLDTYNRVFNGEYAALIDMIQEAYDAEWAKYMEAYNAWRTLYMEEQGLLQIVNGYPVTIAYYEDVVIPTYEALIREAMQLHNGGTQNMDGLLNLWQMAERELQKKEQELRRIEESMAAWEEGLGLIDVKGKGKDWANRFIANEAAWYQAQIDGILEDIANLQQQLIILEGIRADLLEDFQ
ncbi:MAG TPA: hypothetical protein PK401_06715, partial [Bacteroidales bacterium]|nr:hypothetical protein [Bacteroidales bacterium]